MSNGNRQTVSRLSFKELGISRERYLELRAGCMMGEYDHETLSKACRGFEYAETWILLSVTQNRSYDCLEFDSRLGRVVVSRTNFYALRRQFYGNLDKALKEGGAEREAI